MPRVRSPSDCMGKTALHLAQLSAGGESNQSRPRQAPAFCTCNLHLPPSRGTERGSGTGSGTAFPHTRTQVDHDNDNEATRNPASYSLAWLLDPTPKTIHCIAQSSP
ncbi:hypothetical protein HYQ46_005914 [Verticillium longisporum]|nr:hypothetical protein HYQ46_005914 [Verticillium longisporum]